MTTFVLALGSALSTAASSAATAIGLGTAGTAAAGTAAAGAAAAGSTAAAAAGGASALSIGSTALTVLSGGLTLAGVFGSMAAAGDEARTQLMEAENERIAATDAEIRGEQESSRLKRELLATVTSQAVAYAAGGVDLGSGTVRRAKARASKDAERELGLAQNDALRASLAHRHNARNIERRARSIRRSSVFNAIGDIGAFGLETLQRG